MEGDLGEWGLEGDLGERVWREWGEDKGGEGEDA